MRDGENLRSIVTTIIATISCGVIIGMFKMHTDVEIMKSQIESQRDTLQRQQSFSERIDQTLQTLDKTLAVQAETVKALQDSLDRLSPPDKKRK